MSNPSPFDSDRRLTRRRTPKGKARLVCQKGGMGLGVNLALAILDVSETGLRVMLSAELPRGQEVSLSMEGQGTSKPIKRLGNVMWSVPTADGSHCAGIHFQKRLEYAVYLSLT